MSIEYVELTITDAEPINITISDIPEAGSGGGLDPIASNTLLGNLTGSTALPTGQDAAAVRDWLFAIIYAQTTDPGVAGQPWNDNGTLKFSTGYSPSLDFSNRKNSMYLGTLA